MVVIWPGLPRTKSGSLSLILSIDDTLEGDYTDDERRNIFEKAITEFEMYTQKLKNILKYEGKNEIVS